MISSTLGSQPICGPKNLLKSERRKSSSASENSIFAAGAFTKKFTRTSFGACPRRSHSLTTFESEGRLQRSLGIASHESLWGIRRILLHIGGKQVQNGRCMSSSSQSRTHLLELGWKGFILSRPDCLGVSTRYCTRPVIIRNSSVEAGSENEYCDRSQDQPHGACSFRRSSSPNTREGVNYVEVPDGSDPDQSGYTIKVSKELMGVFRYVEKVKRARIKDLANTLKQTAGACMFFSCVRGVLSPLVEVFKTRPPSWGRLILMLSAFDSFAITYLALKASEPLEKLSMLASESDKDIMGSIEKEEEHMLTLAVELVKLFRRLRNITLCTAVAQFASLVHSLLRLNNPKLVADASKVIRVWLHTPWTS